MEATMRRFGVLIAVLLAVFCMRLRADEVPSPEIRAVILGQLEAFRRDDAAAAFGFASPNIQGMFRTPENFMVMVRSGYPPVYRAKRSAFLEPVLSATGLIQPVLITGPDGTLVQALYAMQQQPDGSWRINGCQLQELPAAGA
jgi:hypothetical protein